MMQKRLLVLTFNFESHLSSLQVHFRINSGVTSACPRVTLRPLFVQRRPSSDMVAITITFRCWREWDPVCLVQVSEAWDNLFRQFLPPSCGEPLAAYGVCRGKARSLGQGCVATKISHRQRLTLGCEHLGTSSGV